MSFLVHNITASTMERLNFKPEFASVADLKQSIEKSLQIPTERQVLVFREFYLNAEHQLSDYGISQESVITLKVKPEKIANFFSRNFWVVFAAGFLWGVGHYLSSLLVKYFLADLKPLRKQIAN